MLTWSVSNLLPPLPFSTLRNKWMALTLYKWCKKRKQKFENTKITFFSSMAMHGLCIYSTFCIISFKFAQNYRSILKTSLLRYKSLCFHHQHTKTHTVNVLGDHLRKKNVIMSMQKFHLHARHISSSSRCENKMEFNSFHLFKERESLSAQD